MLKYKLLKPIAFSVPIAALITYYMISVSMNHQEFEANEIIGKAYLEENKGNDGVQVTETGLQYRVLVAGTGQAHPEPKDKVEVHYIGTLIDGTIVENSTDRGHPVEFAVNYMIAGLAEGVQLMVEGGQSRFFIPSNLAYGESNSDQIPAGSTLIFDVELLRINK